MVSVILFVYFSDQNKIIMVTNDECDKSIWIHKRSTCTCVMYKLTNNLRKLSTSKTHVNSQVRKFCEAYFIRVKLDYNDDS
jgi:hypothetical protein